MQKVQEILLNAYLDLSREGSNLRDMAYAKAIMWVLYAEDKALTSALLSKNIAQLVNAHNIPQNAISSALQLLKMRKLITEKNGNWTLSPKEKIAMQRQIQYSTDVMDRILKRRFPNQIEKKKLADWFNESNSSYFSAGADKLIALYTNKQKPVFNVESVVKPIISKYGLSQYESEILQGYKEFLTSTDREEEEKVLNLMRSLLSSKLVSANISPELFSLEKYKDAEIILDTNVLFATRLDRGEDINRAFTSFGKVMSSLNIKLYITDFTKEEYEKVVKREKDNFLLLAKSFSKNIFQGMNQSSDITKALLQTGCQTTEDIERFFDISLSIPEKIGEAPISVLTGKELRGSYYNQEKDIDSLKEIKEATLSRHKNQKAENTAIHDLRLMKLVKKNASSKKTFVLTLDGAMENLALNQVGDKEEPLWVSLYSIIQILAINGAGAGFNPNDLAPLVKMFIEFEEATKEEKYDERDLLLVVEKTDRVNDLTEIQMVSLLNKLHRIKLRRSEEEAVREITIELERTLRQDATKIDKSAKEKQAQIDSLIEEKNQTSIKLQKTTSDLKSEKKSKVWLWFVLRVIIYFLLSLLLAWFLKNEILTDLRNNAHYELVSKILLIISVAGLAISDYLSYTCPHIKNIESS